MGIMSSEWSGRLQHWMRTLKDDFYRPLGTISWEAFRTMEHLSPEEAMKGQFEPVEPGFTWGKTWEYCWFRGKVVLPAEAEGKRIVMDLRPDGESTLFVNGQEFGTYRASWVTQKHHFIEDNVLSTAAAAGTEYEILMETYAGHYYPESQMEAVQLDRYFRAPIRIRWKRANDGPWACVLLVSGMRMPTSYGWMQIR